MHIYDSFQEEGGSYTVFYFDAPAQWVADPGAAQSFLTGTRDGWLSLVQGALLEERTISLGDHPGGEAIVEANVNDVPVKFKIRYYVAQYRYYQITVGIPKDRTFTPEMDAFLQSFALLQD